MNKLIKTLMVFSAAVLAAVVFAPTSYAKTVDGAVVPDNVFICGQNVSGLSLEEAEEVVSAYFDNYSNTTLTLKAGKKSVEADGDDLAITAKNSDVAMRALNYGNEGNLISRYKANNDIKHGKKKDFEISLTATNGVVAKFLEDNAANLNTKASNNAVKLVDGKFKYIEGKEGLTVKVNKSVVAINNFISSDWDGNDATIDLVTKKIEPEGDKKQLSRIKDKLGTYNTDYSESSSARCANVENAVSKINGSVIYPGETFSVYDTVNPFSAENGYELAASYENGTVVETYGGGICQVSTTLYNAVMRSELEIVERSSHSMIVTYVQPSMDAAIAGTAKDFKFKNNTDAPIYIDGYCSDKHVYFTVYGEETRPSDREVTFESEILDQIDPVVEFVYSDEFPAGTIQKTQPAHTGYTAKLWKIVKQGGEETRTVYNNSKYKCTNTVYTIGSNGLSAEGRAMIDQAIATNDLTTVRGAVGNAVNAQPAPADDSSADNSGESSDDKKNEDSNKEDKKKEDKQKEETNEDNSSDDNSDDNSNEG